jgi:hypothetical protein
MLFLLLLSDLRSILGQTFDNVECEMQPCPDLTRSPFNLLVTSLGQLVYIVPRAIPPLEACRQIVGGRVVGTANVKPHFSHYF